MSCFAALSNDELIQSFLRYNGVPEAIADIKQEILDRIKRNGHSIEQANELVDKIIEKAKEMDVIDLGSLSQTTVMRRLGLEYIELKLQLLNIVSKDKTATTVAPA